MGDPMLAVRTQIKRDKNAEFSRHGNNATAKSKFALSSHGLALLERIEKKAGFETRKHIEASLNRYFDGKLKEEIAADRLNCALGTLGELSGHAKVNASDLVAAADFLEANRFGGRIVEYRGYGMGCPLSPIRMVGGYSAAFIPTPDIQVVSEHLLSQVSLGFTVIEGIESFKKGEFELLLKDGIREIERLAGKKAADNARQSLLRYYDLGISGHSCEKIAKGVLDALLEIAKRAPKEVVLATDYLESIREWKDEQNSPIAISRANLLACVATSGSRAVKGEIARFERQDNPEIKYGFWQTIFEFFHLA